MEQTYKLLHLSVVMCSELVDLFHLRMHRSLSARHKYSPDAACVTDLQATAHICCYVFIACRSVLFAHAATCSVRDESAQDACGIDHIQTTAHLFFPLLIASKSVLFSHARTSSSVTSNEVCF